MEKINNEDITKHNYYFWQKLIGKTVDLYAKGAKNGLTFEGTTIVDIAIDPETDGIILMLENTKEETIQIHGKKTALLAVNRIYNGYVKE